MMNGGFAKNIISALYDHANQYDDEHKCDKTEWWKLHGSISRSGYGNAMIGRYGGSFLGRYRGAYVGQRVSYHGIWMHLRSLH